MRYFELVHHDDYLTTSHSIVSDFDSSYVFEDISGDLCVMCDFDSSKLDSQLFLSDRIDSHFRFEDKSIIDTLTDEDLKKQDLINTDFNSIKRVYPDNTVKICVSSRPLNVGGRNEYPVGYGQTADERSILHRIRKSTERKSDGEKSKKSIDRIRKKVFDIALLNQWDYFVTLTFDANKIDRTDFGQVSQRVSQWINDHLVKKYENVKYLVVAENHKRKEANGLKAYHFHMLVANVPASEFVDSGTCLIRGFPKPVTYSTFNTLKKLGHASDSDFKCPVFNITSYSSGFSTAIQVYRNGVALAGYFTKYLTKDLESTELPFGKAGYKSSRGNLVREPDIYYGSFDLKKVPKNAFQVQKEYGSYYFWDNIAEIKSKDQMEMFVFGIHPRLLAGYRAKK